MLSMKSGMLLVGGSKEVDVGIAVGVLARVEVGTWEDDVEGERLDCVPLFFFLKGGFRMTGVSLGERKGRAKVGGG